MTEYYIPTGHSETELVEFLKELQRKGWDRGCAGC